MEERNWTILQALLNHGSMEIDQAKTLLGQINRKYNIDEVDEQDLDKLIQQINKKIEKMDQKIVRVKHDILNTEYVVLANTLEDDINMKQSFFTELDREYFRLLLQELAYNEFHIKYIVALNLISELKPKSFSKNHADELIDFWLSAGYFIKNEGDIYPGPKVLAEFSDYLANNYPNQVKRCHLCMAAILVGISCEHCEELFHRNCLRTAFQKHLNCPKCKHDWNQRI